MSFGWEDTVYDNLFFTKNSKTDIYIDDVFEKIKTADRSNVYEFFVNDVFKYKEDSLSTFNIRNYINVNYSADDTKLTQLDEIINKVLDTIMYGDMCIDEEQYIEEAQRSNDIERYKFVCKKIEEFADCIRSEYIHIKSDNEARKYIDELKREVTQIESTIDMFYKKVEDEKIDMIKTTNEFIANIKKDVYKEIMAIVGIFTAISFGAFGGMTLLNELFSNAGNIRLNDLIIIGCISSIFILTLVYIIIDYLSKLTGIKIENEDKDKSRFCNFRVNHTPLYFSYLFITIILIGTFIVR